MRLSQTELSQQVAVMASALDPNQGITSRPPAGESFGRSPSHPIPWHTCILPHIFLPPASEALTGPKISTAGLTFLPLEQVCRLEIRQLQRSEAWSQLGPLPSSSACFLCQFTVLGIRPFTFPACRALQKLQGYLFSPLPFLSWPPLASSQFLNPLHSTRLAAIMSLQFIFRPDLC